MDSGARASHLGRESLAWAAPEMRGEVSDVAGIA
jgi:hypothetical protein